MPRPNGRSLALQTGWPVWSVNFGSQNGLEVIFCNDHTFMVLSREQVISSSLEECDQSMPYIFASCAFKREVGIDPFYTKLNLRSDA